MENKITQEMIEQAKQAQSAEEILCLAKENGVELTAEEAQKYYDMWHASTELSDEEMDNVAGGGLCDDAKCPNCGAPYNDWQVLSVQPRTHWHKLYRYKCRKCGHEWSEKI